MKQLGRPDDKNKYVTSVLSTLNSSLGTDELGNMDAELTSALNKLNAKELITLNTYIAKQNRMSVEQTVSLLPATTPTQKTRIDEAVKLYKELEIKDASHTRQTHEQAHPITRTESANFKARR